MAGKRSDTSREIVNKIDQALAEGMSRRAEEIAARLVPKLRAKQKTFFAVLGQKIIGAKSAPNLGEYTPEWQPLTETYKAYRLKRKNVAGSRFYEYRSRKGESGKTSLKDLLASAKAETAFGQPLAYKSKGRGRGRFSSQITVLPFPKVVEDLTTSLIDEKDYLRSSNRPIAWRLRNYKGSRLRPILREFMLWWMNVEMRKIIEQELRK